MMDLNSKSMMDKDKARNIILATVFFLVSPKIECCLCSFPVSILFERLIEAQIPQKC